VVGPGQRTIAASKDPQGASVVGEVMPVASRRLRKAEQAVVDAAVAESLVVVADPLRALQVELVDGLMARISPELEPFAVRAFITAVINEIYLEADLAHVYNSAERGRGPDTEFGGT
jgi:hypothetical protein